MLDAGFSMLDAGYWMLDAGYLIFRGSGSWFVRGWPMK